MHTPLEMNGRARRPAAVARGGSRAAPRNEKVMEKGQRRPNSKAPAVTKPSSNSTTPGIKNRSQSRRDRKMALQQDVDKLRKKLRHEENVHRALERAFTRPLGALPRLPPYLPSQTLELLAEVAVLEEEVVRLEEKVVNFRQGLYEEAIITSLAKNAYFPDRDRTLARQNLEVSTSTRQGSDSDQDTNWSSWKRATNVKQTTRKPGPSISQGDLLGKENQSCGSNSCREFSRTPLGNLPKCRMPVVEKCTAVQFQSTSTVEARHKALDDSNGIDADKASTLTNKVSEELLTCLMAIFSQMSTYSGQDDERASSPSVSGSCASSSDGLCTGDPYGVLEFGCRDIGPYKHFRAVDAASLDHNVFAGDTHLGWRLKALLHKLSSVDLAGLTHQQRLAFWINTYNACMLNAFLEHGARTTPHMLVAMMPKATINVGGRMLTAMTIEHFILRLPYNVKHVDTAGAKCDMAARGVFGLEWPEPLVTFALSCGSWSSPAVRVYTAAHVEEDLETAKRDYLQAAVGVSLPGGLTIPKLLHWYLPDFAKDVSSLVDWVCLQLPCELQRDAVRAVETADRQRQGSAVAAPRRVRVMPYEFRFRYLLAS